MNTGRLFLVPCPIAAHTTDLISAPTRSVTIRLKHYFVENLRTSRRYLKEIDKSIDIDSIQFREINNHTPPDVQLLRNWLKEGFDVGVMSESGCPGIADPGSILVKAAHEMNTEVIPLIGPSSILLALMASGFNGQRFRFLGYLPVKEPLRTKSIKELELNSSKLQETQIFIETPYRNNRLLQDLLKNCHPNSYLCIATDITLNNAFIKTKKIKEWMGNIPDLNKKPTVFLLMA